MESEAQATHLKRKREDHGTPEANEVLGILSADSKQITPVPQAFNRANKHLRIEIPTSKEVEPATSPSSLFSLSEHSEISAVDCLLNEIFDTKANLPPASDRIFLARRTAPPIPGLFFSPSLRLPCELANSIMLYCQETYFKNPGANQVMLFGRFGKPSSSSNEHQSSQSTSGLPLPLLDLLDTLSVILLPVLPKTTYDLLFPLSPTKARQAIINLYHPGEGISPHVDLLGRYGDGIIGVSFGSGTVMRFDNVTKGDSAVRDRADRWDVYLPERSIITLSESARYDWTHGIEKRKQDYVILSSTPDDPGLTSENTHKTPPDCQEQCIERGMRISITFRWLLPGADVVGEADHFAL